MRGVMVPPTLEGGTCHETGGVPILGEKTSE